MAKLLGKRRLPYIDARTEKWNQYEEYITSQGFAIYQVRGDGNCLFRAIAHQMDQDETLYATYRKLAVDYMRSHPYQFKFNLRTEQDGTFDEYLKKMERNREWGGHFEIFALSEALNVQIWLFQESFSVLKIGGPEYEEDDNLINS